MIMIWSDDACKSEISALCSLTVWRQWPDCVWVWRGGGREGGKASESEREEMVCVCVCVCACVCVFVCVCVCICIIIMHVSNMKTTLEMYCHVCM